MKYLAFSIVLALVYCAACINWPHPGLIAAFTLAAIALFSVGTVVLHKPRKDH